MKTQRRSFLKTCAILAVAPSAAIALNANSNPKPHKTPPVHIDHWWIVGEWSLKDHVRAVGAITWMWSEKAEKLFGFPWKSLDGKNWRVVQIEGHLDERLAEPGNPVVIFGRRNGAAFSSNRTLIAHGIQWDTLASHLVISHDGRESETDGCLVGGILLFSRIVPYKAWEKANLREKAKP